VVVFPIAQWFMSIIEWLKVSLRMIDLYLYFNPDPYLLYFINYKPSLMLIKDKTVEKALIESNAATMKPGFYELHVS